MHQLITIPELTETVFPLNLAAELWQPIVLLGGPGTGKTSIMIHELVELYARFMGVTADDIGLVTEKPARRDSVELAGLTLPHKENGEYVSKNTKSPVICKIEETGKKYGILLWDELAAAGAPEQKVAADSLDPEEHALGGNDLPRGWIVVATGNRVKDKAGALNLLTHLTNRTMTFEVEFSFPGWKKWAEKNGVNPIIIECAGAYFDQGFFADSVPQVPGAFCTPRSLVRAGKHLDAYMATPAFTGTIPPVIERMLAANIGPDSANVLCQWIAQRGHVPTAAEILRDPEGAQVPDQTGFQMIAANIAMAAVNDAKSATAVLHYVCRLRPDLQVSLGTKLMGISARSGWTVTDPLAAAFIEKFHELLPLALTD